MKDELYKIAGGPERQAYLKMVRRRYVRGTWEMRARFTSMHLSWIMVLAAGAAVVLVGAIDAPNWIGAVLGFVVVVFQGFDRIFQRTSDGALAVDELRRGLGREQRQLLVNQGEYASAEDPFALFVRRSEEMLVKHDITMADYFQKLSKDGVGLD